MKANASALREVTNNPGIYLFMHIIRAVGRSLKPRSELVMGYDLGRFQGDVDEELICTICGGVFQEPRQVSPGEHCFCNECIQE